MTSRSIALKDFMIFVCSQSMETSVKIVSIIALCWDAMMHDGIALKPPLENNIYLNLDNEKGKLEKIETSSYFREKMETNYFYRIYLKCYSHIFMWRVSEIF